MKDYAKNIALFVALILVVGLGTSTVVFASQKQEPETFIKLNPGDTSERVQAFFKNRSTKMDSLTQIVWDVDGSEVNQELIFVQFNIKGAEAKALFEKRMFKEGYKKYAKTCKQLSSSVKNEWSFGVCYRTQLTGKKA